MFAADYTMDNNDDDYACAMLKVSPYPDRRWNLVSAEGYVSCVGSVITHTRLQVHLKREGTTLKYYNSEWRPFLSHGKTVRGRCASGWHDYSNTVSYQVLFVNGSIGRHPPETVESRIECP